MLLQTSGMSSPRQKKEKISYRCMSAYSFSRYSPIPFSRPHCFRFLSLGSLKTPRVFSWNLKWRDTSTHFIMPFRPFATARGLLKGCDGPCSDVSMRPLRIFWAFVVNCELINNENLTVLKSGMCIVSVLCQL